MDKIDKGLENLNESLDIAKTELDHRTAEEKKAEKLTAEGRYEEARAVLAALDDKVLKGLLEE